MPKIELAVHVPALEPDTTPPAGVPQPRWSVLVDQPPEIPPFLIVGPSLTVVQPRVTPGGGPPPEPIRLEIAFTGERAELLGRHRSLVHTVPRDLNVPDLVEARVETDGEPRVVVEIRRDVFARLDALVWCRFVVSLRVRVTTADGHRFVMPLPVGVQLFDPDARLELGERVKAAASPGSFGRGRGRGRRSALAAAELSGPDDGRLCLEVDARSGEPLRFPNLFAPQPWEGPHLMLEPLLCFVRSGVGLHLLLEQAGQEQFVAGPGSTLDPRLLGSSAALSLFWQGVSHPKLAQGPRDGLAIGHSNPDIGLVGTGTDGKSAEIAWFEGAALEVPRIASLFFSVTDEKDNARLVDPTVMNDPVEVADPIGG